MPKTILIVEDEQFLREALADKLKRQKFSVTETKNGKEGLDAALKNHPDLILLDIIMPVMDGITMLKKLREDKWGKNANVMLLTNLSAAEDVASALDKGVYDYLVKSGWTLEEIVEKINKTPF